MHRALQCAVIALAVNGEFGDLVTESAYRDQRGLPSRPGGSIPGLCATAWPQRGRGGRCQPAASGQEMAARFAFVGPGRPRDRSRSVSLQAGRSPRWSAWTRAGRQRPSRGRRTPPAGGRRRSRLGVCGPCAAPPRRSHHREARPQVRDTRVNGFTAVTSTGARPSDGAAVRHDAQLTAPAGADGRPIVQTDADVLQSEVEGSRCTFGGTNGRRRSWTARPRLGRRR